MWPGGARCAASFTFDFDAEEVWIGEDPENAHRPGVLSQGTYGAKVAVPALLALLERRGVRATFFVPGRVAERHPARVAAIVAAGHELAHHGYTHTAPSRLSRDEEEAELARGLEVLRSFGAEITGYRSPWWDFSPHTLGLLAGHGFAYSSNMMDDVRPYRHDGSSLVEVPIPVDPGRRRAFLVRRRLLDQEHRHHGRGPLDLGRGVPRHPADGRLLRVHHAPADHRPAGQARLSRRLHDLRHRPRGRVGRHHCRDREPGMTTAA